MRSLIILCKSRYLHKNMSRQLFNFKAQLQTSGHKLLGALWLDNNTNKHRPSASLFVARSVIQQQIPADIKSIQREKKEQNGESGVTPRYAEYPFKCAI